MYWQYYSIMMSVTLILTSVLPLEPTGPERALLWATWTYSHVSDSPSFAPTPFHQGGMVAPAQPLCSSAGTSRKQVGFCIPSLRLVTHHFVRSKGIRWRRGCCVCGPEDPGKKRNMEFSIGEMASCSKWGEAHILGNLAGVEDRAPGKKMQNTDLITQLGDSLYHKKSLGMTFEISSARVHQWLHAFSSN